MTRFYLLDEANDQLGDLEPILLGLREQRQELIRLRDIVLEAESEVPAETGASGGSDRHELSAEDLRRVRLRMQGLIDQMQAAVGRLDELGIVLRDIETGLIDFPALVSGRQVWLCWRLGEREVGWWHELTSGVAGRRPILDLA